MVRTEYSWMSTEELLAYVSSRDELTSLEVELMQRLTVATDMLQPLPECDEGDA